MQATTSSNVDRYEKMEKLGEGTYGVVYKARDKNTGEVRNSTEIYKTRIDRCSKEDQTRERRRRSA